MNRKNTTDKIFGSKIFWVFASLVCAIVLWVYVTSTVGAMDQKTFEGVSVELVGADELREARGYVVTEQDITSVSVTITAPRRLLTSLSSSELKAVVDLSAIKSSGNQQMLYNIVYPSGVDVNQISNLRRNPSSINIFVDATVDKLVPVKGVFSGTTAEGFKEIKSTDMVFDPANVWISGPSSEVETVTSALVVIERTDVNKPINVDMTYTLVDAEDNPIEDDDNIVLTNETVNVTLPVKAVKEVPLKITVFPGGGATETNLTVSIEPKTVEIAGPADVLEGINEIVLGQIFLSKLVADDERTYPLALPEGASTELEIISEVTEATVKYEIKGLDTTILTVSNFECVNVPAGYKATVTTKSLDVKVRGKTEDIGKIGPSDFRIVVDLSDISVSTDGRVLPAVIYIDDYPDMGVIGDNYTAIVVLSVYIEEDDSN